MEKEKIVVKVILKYGLLFLQKPDLSFTYSAFDTMKHNYRELLIEYCIKNNMSIHPHSKDCFVWLNNKGI